MGAPNSLLGTARSFARDFPRDQMPAGYLWDVTDYVPTIVDAPLTGRGGWRWGSTALSADAQGGILATFSEGDKLLVHTWNNRWMEVDQTDPYTAHDHGPARMGLQNPVQLQDTVVHMDGTGADVPQLLTNVPGYGIATGDAHPSAYKGRYATVYKSRLVTGGALGELDAVRFTVPGNNNLPNDEAYDDNSFIRTSKEVTGLAALRSVLIVFHKGSVERIRGSIPPYSPEGKGDMFVESLFDRAGCPDAKSIAYWNDNVIFADEHGVHMTDGATVRNLVSQGGILTYWRPLYEHKQQIAACTFLDYYLVTVKRDDGLVVTLLCDLTRRQWFRFTNINAYCYITSSGASSMERVWAGMIGTGRLARLGPCFFPDLEVAPLLDDDGTAVLPAFETPWFRLGQEGRKRVRFGYLSYDARLPSLTTPVLDFGYLRSPQQHSYTSVGTLPATSEYTRYRLPLGQFPYGVAFRVAQTQATSALRVFDLGVEQWPAERSRL